MRQAWARERENKNYLGRGCVLCLSLYLPPSLSVLTNLHLAWTAEHDQFFCAGRYYCYPMCNGETTLLYWHCTECPSNHGKPRDCNTLYGKSQFSCKTSESELIQNLAQIWFLNFFQIFLGRIVSHIAPSFQVVGSENYSALSRDLDQVRFAFYTKNYH